MTIDTDAARDFIPYPIQRVVGTIADAQHARAAIEALLQQGFQRSDIDVLSGERGLHRLDPSGSDMGSSRSFNGRCCGAWTGRGVQEPEPSCRRCTRRSVRDHGPCRGA